MKSAGDRIKEHLLLETCAALHAFNGNADHQLLNHRFKRVNELYQQLEFHIGQEDALDFMESILVQENDCGDIMEQGHHQKRRVGQNRCTSIDPFVIIPERLVDQSLTLLSTPMKQ